jgi:predicted RNA binding protein YcfA (HicA-like mRNA interferase family)
MDKDLKKLIEALEAQGFTVERTTKGHVMVYRDAILVVTFSGTASDWRAMKNGIAKARRFGFKWPPRR